MSPDDHTWYELRPDGERTADADRFRDRAEAEQAASQVLIKRQDLAFVDVAHCELGDGESTTLAVSRVEALQPPAPTEGEVDALHLLPRGEPEC